MQTSIARPIAFATDVVQRLQQRAQRIEILQPDNVFVLDSFVAVLRPASRMAESKKARKCKCTLFFRLDLTTHTDAHCVPNSIDNVPVCDSPPSHHLAV